MMAFQAVVRQHIANFAIRKSKVFIKVHIRNGMHHQVVQPRKDALLRYAQTTGQHSEKQAVVRFQRQTKHRTNQIDHPVVIAVRICLIQRHIVFVDQQKHLLPVMLFEKRAKHS